MSEQSPAPGGPGSDRPSEEPPPSAAEGQARPSQAASSGSGGLIIRILVWGAVAVVVVLAILELIAKKNAEDSFEAMDAALAEANKSKTDLTANDLKQHVSGNPTESKIERDNEGRWRRTYTWSGILKSYVVVVYFVSDEENSLVDKIEGVLTPAQVDAGQDGPNDE